MFILENGSCEQFCLPLAVKQWFQAFFLWQARGFHCFVAFSMVKGHFLGCWVERSSEAICSCLRSTRYCMALSLSLQLLVPQLPVVHLKGRYFILYTVWDS